MDCMVYGVANSWAWLSNVHFPSPGDFPNPGMEPRSFLSFNFTTRQVQKWLLFLFRSSCFILSGAITNCPPLFPNSILDTFLSGGLIFQCHVFLPFHTVHGFWVSYCYWVLQTRILEWFAIPSSSVLSEFSTITCPSLVAMHVIAHSFTEMYNPPLHHKAVMHERNTDYYTISKMS